MSSTDTNYFSFFFREDDVLLKDTLKLQSFPDSVSLPLVIVMEGWERQAASTDCRGEGETHHKIEPFLLSFKSKNDDGRFCVEMFDRRNLEVFASFES